MNTTILWLVAHISATKYQWWRIGIAAMFASLYALGFGISSLRFFYHPLVKFFIPIIIIMAAFKWISLRKSCMLVGLFYLVSFIVGGAVLAWGYFWQTFQPEQYGILHNNYSWKELLGGGVIVCVLIVGLLWTRLLQRTIQGKNIYTIRIGWQGNSVELKALLDTGNGLYSMEGHSPVVIVERGIVEKIVGEKVIQFLRDTKPELWISELESCQDQEWLARIRIIPCQTVGASHLILGFQPDFISVVNPNAVPFTGDVVIGIVANCLSSMGEYAGLLHPAVVNSIIERSERNCA